VSALALAFSHAGLPQFVASVSMRLEGYSLTGFLYESGLFSFRLSPVTPWRTDPSVCRRRNPPARFSRMPIKASVVRLHGLAS